MKRKTKMILAGLGIGVLALGLLVWLGAPLLVKAMGVHPDYTGQRYLLTKGRALIITTSHDSLGDDGTKTGVFASEMTVPYYEFVGGRMEVDVASIEGGAIPIDPLSFIWAVETPEDKRFKIDPVFQAKVHNSMKIDQVDFTEYDIIYLAGGWGAAYDLGTSEILGGKITEAYAEGKIIGGVCHGPLGILQAHDPEGNPLVRGRRVTAVTDKQVEELGITLTPQHPERELRAAGAEFEAATAFRDFFANHVVVDGQLVTGQNQNAGAEVANLMMKAAGGSRR